MPKSQSAPQTWRTALEASWEARSISSAAKIIMETINSLDSRITSSCKDSSRSTQWQIRPYLLSSVANHNCPRISCMYQTRKSAMQRKVRSSLNSRCAMGVNKRMEAPKTAKILTNRLNSFTMAQASVALKVIIK